MSKAEHTRGLPVVVSGLNKSFKDVHAVKNLTFTAEPGRVTGFLGPNGSGKTTTLQMLLGLIKQDSGIATIGGKQYAELERPGLTVGASIAAVFHPAHTGRAHLDIMRRAIGAHPKKVAELLELTGISAAADRKIGGYSLGMKQRLALAAALLGDPKVIVLDEPVNGLDPEGIRWIRMFLRHLASEGKTVLLSSHMLAEVQQTVDDAVIIRRGELVFSGPLKDLGHTSAGPFVLVDSRDRLILQDALVRAGFEILGIRNDGPMRVPNATPAEVGEVASIAGVPLTHLSAEQVDLELSFLNLIESFGTGESGSATFGSATFGTDSFGTDSFGTDSFGTDSSNTAFSNTESSGSGELGTDRSQASNQPAGLSQPDRSGHSAEAPGSPK
ncbi:MAG TPA: ATP-binding cassette domain-containing protein [Microbacteriaceae bacterium]|nr:ATP-binding cassette domain-containing protein [Microbacteriaceae bacterium]